MVLDGLAVSYERGTSAQVPSNPQAGANREVIGATPSVLEGLERLVRSGSPNAAYHACEVSLLIRCGMIPAIAPGTGGGSGFQV